MDRKYYMEYYHLERNHWWFKARLKILESQIKKLVGKEIRNFKILNVGVATGATTKMLEKYGKVTSVEYDQECCEFLNKELKIESIQASFTNLPFEPSTFDLVCAFDVIEHIEDDNLALKELKRVLKNEGKFVLTVPAFNFLWSKHDEINHHFRRYTLKNFNHQLQKINLIIIYQTYFNFYFFLPIAFIRSVKKLIVRKSKNKDTTGSDFELLNKFGFLNKLLYYIFKSENYLLSIKFRFPFGISILVVGKKL